MRLEGFVSLIGCMLLLAALAAGLRALYLQLSAGVSPVVVQAPPPS